MDAAAYITHPDTETDYPGPLPGLIHGEQLHHDGDEGGFYPHSLPILPSFLIKPKGIEKNYMCPGIVVKLYESILCAYLIGPPVPGLVQVEQLHHDGARVRAVLRQRRTRVLHVLHPRVALHAQGFVGIRGGGKGPRGQDHALWCDGGP